MIKRRAFAAALPGLVAGILLATAPGPAPAGGAPPLAGDFVDNFTLLNPPVPAPLEAFQGLDGRRVHLADFAGKVVLLNFWATWCAPCVREMPSLDRLQARLRDDGLAVVAVSLDRGGAEVVRPFVARLKLTQMGLYLDPDSALSKAFGITGLPTTFVIDAEGRIVGAQQGSADWDSPAALALMRYYLSERSRSDNQSAANE